MTRRIRSTVWLMLVPLAALLGVGSLPAGAQPIRYGISPGEIELVPASGGTATFVVVAPRLAARLLVAIRGTEVVQGAIVNMLAAPRPRGAGADIRVTFRNKGNVHLHTRGEIELLDASGQRIGKLPLPEAVVLPASVREFK